MENDEVKAKLSFLAINGDNEQVKSTALLGLAIISLADTIWLKETK